MHKHELMKNNDTKQYKSDNQQQGINMIYLNSRSLLPKLDDIEIHIKQKGEPEILAVTETWLYENQTTFAQRVKYNAIHKCRSTGRGGGIVFYIRHYQKYPIL